jgi:hypothetical protein
VRAVRPGGRKRIAQKLQSAGEHRGREQSGRVTVRRFSEGSRQIPRGGSAKSERGLSIGIGLSEETAGPDRRALPSKSMVSGRGALSPSDSACGAFIAPVRSVAAKAADGAPPIIGCSETIHPNDELITLGQ